jgi:hypothetical protein
MLKLGPADHGRPMTLEEFETASALDGYQYELIETTYTTPLLPGFELLLDPRS